MFPGVPRPKLSGKEKRGFFIIIKMLHHTLRIMCNKSLEDFIPPAEHMLSLDRLNVQLAPNRPMLRADSWQFSALRLDDFFVFEYICIYIYIFKDKEVQFR